MGKFAALTIAAFMIAGAFYSMSSQQGMMRSSEEIANKQYEVVTRNGAIAGYNRAKQALAESWSDRSLTGEYEGVGYQVASEVSGDHAVVNSVSTVNGAGRDVSYTVRAQFKKFLLPLPEDPPAFMQFAVLADQNLTLNGNVSAGLDVEGEEGNEMNADMHTNGNLTVQGNAARVAGFGTFVGSGSGHLENTFNPTYMPVEDQPDAYQAAAVGMPEVDIPLWKSSLVADREDGNVTLSGTIDGGTREAPMIWVIDGDLSTSPHGAEINGYIMFIVDGDIDLQGDLTVGDSGFGGSESSIALYASGNLDMTGNMNVEAQIYTAGDVSFTRGTPTLTGSLATLSTVRFSGTPDILYRPASPALTTNWVPRETIVRMTGYHER